MAKSVLSRKNPAIKIIRKKARDLDGKAYMKEPKLGKVSTTCSLQLANLVAAIELACVSLGVEKSDDPLYNLNAIVSRTYGYKAEVAALALSSRCQYQKILVVNAELQKEVDALRPAGVAVDTIRRRLLGLPKEET